MTRNAVGVITDVDDAVVDMLGWRPDQLIGFPSTRFLHPEDQPSGIAAWVEMITSPGSPMVWTGRYQAADGTWQWVETVNCLEDSESPMVRTTMTRVTVERVSIEEELRARKQLLNRLSDALPAGLFQIDATGQLTFTNDRLHTIVGLPPVATIGAQLSTVVVEDVPLLEVALADVLADRPVDDIEIRLVPPPAESSSATDAQRVCLLSLRALTDGSGTVSGAIGLLSDVTDRVQLRRELEVRASVDQLTSCLNRASTLELLESTIAHADATERGIAVIFVDLDEFKAVNDVYGHAAGDRLLVIAAERLRGAVRTCDRVGRVGGDEFLVICPGVESPSKAVEVGERLARALTASIGVRGGTGVVELRASVGVAWTIERLDADSFIAQADTAMYQSKKERSGLSSVTLFEHADSAA